MIPSSMEGQDRPKQRGGHQLGVQGAWDGGGGQFLLLLEGRALFSSFLCGPHCKWRTGENPLYMSGSHLIYSQKLKCDFQNRIIMFCLPVPTLWYLWEIYIIPGSVYLFCCREICGPILVTDKSLTDTWMWTLELRPRNSQKRIRRVSRIHQQLSGEL